VPSMLHFVGARLHVFLESAKRDPHTSTPRGAEHIGLCLPTLARCVHKSRRSHELYQPLAAEFHAVQCDQGRRYSLRKQVIRVVFECACVPSSDSRSIGNGTLEA